jgi:predicted Ser/Thr protein kinase/tetratricopeptide (TPR) repeat protein
MAALAPAPVYAGPLIVVDAHSELDLRDEADGFTLLLRHALARPDRPLLSSVATMTGPAWTTRNAVAKLGQVQGDAAILVDISREGTGLRASVVVISKDGNVNAALARSGDGDIRGLVEGVATHVGEVTSSRLSPVPFASLGELQPFISAQRALSSTAANRYSNAVALVAAGDPVIALRVSSIADRLGPQLLLPGDDAAASPRLTIPQRLFVMRIIGTPSDLDLASKHLAGVMARAAEAFVDGPASKLAALDASLQSREPVAVFARALIAQRRNDTVVRDRLILELLAGELKRSVLAWATSLPPRGFSPALHKAMLATVDKDAGAQGLATKVALAAAEVDVERDRALAMIDVRQLNDIEVGRLEPLLTKCDDRIKRRLQAEIAIRRNDNTQAGAIELLVNDVPSERKGHLYRGRQLMADKLYREAANEFAKSGSVREHARALALAGDLKEALALAQSIGSDDSGSAEILTLRATFALAQGNVEQARELAAQAEQAAPADPSVNRIVVTVASKQPPGDASQQTALATISAIADVVAPTSIATAGPTTTQTGSAANVQPQSAMASALLPLLESMPSLRGLASKDIVVAELGWSPPIYSLRTVTSDVVRKGLVEALSRPPLGLQTVANDPGIQHEPIDKTTLRRLSGSHGGVLFYQVSTDGGQAHVRLLLFPSGSSEGVMVERSIAANGALGWSFEKLLPIAVVIALLVMMVALWVIRGNGDIDVRYKLDADSKDEVFGLIVAKTKSRPSIADRARFYADTPKAGQRIEKRRAILIGGQTKFRVPPGQWQVVLYGVFDRADQLVEVPTSAVKSVDVRRGKTEFVTFDLIPKDAELRINIHGQHQRGVAVWLNHNQTEKVYTDEHGNASLRCSLGSHVLYAEYDGHVFDRKLQIAAPRIERVAMNLEREMKLAAVTGVAASAVDNPPAVRSKTPFPAMALARTESPLARSIDAVEAIDLGDLDEPDAPHVAPIAQPNAETGLHIAGLMNETAPAHATAFLPDVSGPSPPAPRAAAQFNKPSAHDGFFEPAKKSQVAKAGASPSEILQRGNSKELLLERYEIRKELGRGAMGVVYRAWDTNLERDVAIKSLAKELRSHPDALRMFQQEAKALAQMNHSNIVSVFDQVTAGDDTYLIMEFVDGRTLDEILQQRVKFPWLEAAAIIDNICGGLAYAHGRLVIHRDIKPANIFIAKDRSVKLGDFGLARVVREMSIRKTEIRGTPLYMAPEQIMGRDIDARSDLYAVGCTFFELVTGRPPFIEGEIMYAQLHEKPVNPCELVAGIDPSVSELILQMIAKAADDRPESASAIRARLRAITSAALLG